MMKQNRIRMAGLVLLAMLSASVVWGHGDVKPMHGGMVQVTNHVSIELVLELDGASLYLMEHGQPLASKGMTGKLTILQGSLKSEAELKATGENRLRAAGVKLGKGDKLVAVLNQAGGKSLTVRFTVR